MSKEKVKHYPVTYKGRNLDSLTKEELIDALIETYESLRKTRRLLANLQMEVVRDAGLQSETISEHPNP